MDAHARAELLALSLGCAAALLFCRYHRVWARRFALVCPLLAALSAPSAPLADRNPFGWILCVSEVTQRDEDLFSTLQSLRGGADATDGSGAVVTSLSSHDVLSPPPSSRSELGREEPTLWTCCVGKTLSQATYHLSDSNETVWRLFSLLESRLEAEQRRAS